jgi:hypothetical protein
VDEDSILDVTKQLCGIADPDDTSYDLEIITHINTVFFVLRSLGVGPVNGFSITSNAAKWTEFTGEEDIHAVRTYMGLKVRMLFDPPATGPATQAMERQASHLEWLLNIDAEGVKWDEAHTTSL